MKLLRFKYSEQNESGERWEIGPLTFGNFNLIVGRNATGKTRLLKALARTAAELSGELPRKTAERDHEITLESETTSVPAANREMEWGRRTQFFPFAGEMNLKRHSPDGSIQRQTFPEVFKNAREALDPSFERELLREINAIGYEFAGISPVNGSRGKQLLEVREARRESNTPFRKLSQGQQRTLTLLTFLAVLEKEGQPITVLIDDFAEGLDFERSEQLTQHLLQRSARSNFQFILASNDRYVMNAVPLEHWTILVENRTRTHVFNYTNSKQKFDEFKFTGLNNFDFFSMDFARQST